MFVILLPDKSTDLDVPLEFVSIEKYRATLGHKACHSFTLKNAKFKEFFHPRLIDDIQQFNFNILL